MDNSFQLDIVTPSQSLFSGKVVSTTVPGTNGLFQVLSGHAPFLSSVGEGKVDIALPDNTEKTVLIKAGFFEVSDGKAVLIVTESA